MKLGEIVKEYRELNKLSLGDMANRTGYSKTYIAMLESNFNPSTKKPITPTSVTLKKCADAMNLTIHELVKMLDPDQLIDLVYAENLTPLEHVLVSDFRQLTPEGQNIVTSTATGLVNNPQYNLKAQATQPEMEEAPPEATDEKDAAASSA